MARKRGRAPSQHFRSIGLVLAGLLAGSLLVTPAFAHIGTSVAHLWTAHIEPLSRQIFFTKAEASALFAPNDLRTYCQLAAADPRSFSQGPCRSVSPFPVAKGYGLTQSLSLAIGPDGLPIASFWSGDPSRELRVAQCDNPGCTGVITVNTVDAPADPNNNTVGVDSSLAIGVDGLPIIAQYDEMDGDLRVSHCGNSACSLGNVSTTVDEGGGFDVGSFPSIAIGSDREPVISYFDQTNGNLRVMRCNDVACTGNDEGLTTVDTGVSGPNSITIGTDGLPIISYAAGGVMKTAHCGNDACNSGVVIRTLDSSGAGQNSIAIGLDGKPVISYVRGTFPNYSVRVAHCANVRCNTGTIRRTLGTGGTDTAIAIGLDGMPRVSYFREVDQYVAHTYLKVVRCGTASCGSGNITRSFGPIYGGSHTDVAIGIDGRPLVAYWQQFSTLMYFRPKI